MTAPRSAAANGSAVVRRRQIAWHPIGFAAAYVLNAYIAESVSPYSALRALVAALMIAALLQLLLWAVLRNGRRGALAATGVAWFVVFGRDLVLIVQNAVRAVPVWLLLVLVALIAGVLVMGIHIAALSLRRDGGLKRWTSGLNSLATVLLIVVIGGGLLSGRGGQTVTDLRQGTTLAGAPDRSDAQRPGPDIYVILLDGHARSDVLADRFGYDNRPFLAALESRGFEVAPASHSNYTLTQLTLISMFHMALLADIPAVEPLLNGASDNWNARRLLSENPAFELLRDRGYTIVAFQLQAEDVTLRQADVLIDNSLMTEFEGELLASTFAVDLIQQIAPDLMPSAQRARIDGAFDNLVHVAQSDRLGPRFVFGHVAAPHSPLVFGALGEPLRVPEQRRKDDTAAGLGLTDAEFAQRFAGQTAYVDDRTLETIDSILAASPEPPVIIVMSDHGSRSRVLDPATATPDTLRERFGTLFAAYTPGRVGVFHPDETPAAIMVDLLNAYFGADLPEPAEGTFASRIDQRFSLTRVPEPPAPN